MSGSFRRRGRMTGMEKPRRQGSTPSTWERSCCSTSTSATCFGTAPEPLLLHMDFATRLPDIDVPPGTTPHYEERPFDSPIWWFRRACTVGPCDWCRRCGRCTVCGYQAAPDSLSRSCCAACTRAARSAAARHPRGGEERLRRIAAELRDGESLRQAARRLGVSHMTIRRARTFALPSPLT